MNNVVNIILGNSNSRFSGVTSTMLQVLEVQKSKAEIVVLGPHHLPADVRSVSLREAAEWARQSRLAGLTTVFHARRNNEMIQALLLRYVFLAPLRIVFTSTAQRQKSWITRWLMRRMDGVLSTCEAAARYIATPPDQIIPHGIDANLYLPATDRDAAYQKLGLPGRYGIGIFGRVRQQKGIDTLLESAMELLADYPDWSVVIVGEITPEQHGFVEGWQRRINQAGLSEQVVFTGKLPFEQIPAYFKAMSVVTALSRTEGFGLTVLEAMSTEAAVVATEAGAWPDIVESDRDGYIIPVADSLALTAHLKRLMENPKLRAEMGAAGRAKVLASYTVEREAQALLDYYRWLADS